MLRLGQGRSADAQDEGVGKRKVEFLTTLTVGCTRCCAWQSSWLALSRRLPRRGVCVGRRDSADEGQLDKQPSRSKEPEPMRERKMTTERFTGVLSAGSSTAC